ncbi:helix-turn-helix transcriptional regulator [Kitasatospora sp. NA04385]|uniref:TetR/AcrR family transcriptional regulator n=1 Tax=Kitasatospora sp. NA04385 TaxID=2742135 RepID=UPI00159206D1|nr:helix-turn-helix domain-containing protein [Kitasatospora sp. NA04385]QKW18551.1 helix-turn-helix transcriptional regulator [Kitasatospora sp. NA04385]
MNGRTPTLRERQRARTRQLLQTHAVRLFTERGYDAVTVADVAEAAGVSPMTVYRHFPTKEDLALVDRPARLIAERVAASSAAQPLVRRVGGALVEAAAALTREHRDGAPDDPDGADGADGADGNENGDADGDGPAVDRGFLLDCLRLMVTTPALRARHLDSQYALQEAVLAALARADADADTDADAGPRTAPAPAPDPDAVFRARAATSACLAAMHTALTCWAEDDGRGDLPDLISRALAASFGEDAFPARREA